MKSSKVPHIISVKRKLSEDDNPVQKQQWTKKKKTQQKSFSSSSFKRTKSAKQ